MARILEKLLHVNSRIAKCTGGFGLGHGHGIDQGCLGMHHTHATPATAAGSLDDDRISNHLGNPAHLRRVIRQFAFRARNAGNTRFDHRLLG